MITGQKLGRSSKDRTLWRAMIVIIIKGYGNERKRKKNVISFNEMISQQYYEKLIS